MVRRNMNTTALASALVQHGDHILHDTPAFHLDMLKNLDSIQKNAMVVCIALTNGDCLTVVSERKTIQRCSDFWLPSAIVERDDTRRLKRIVEELTKSWTGLLPNEFMVDYGSAWEQRAPYAFEETPSDRMYQTLCVRVRFMSDSDKYDPHPDPDIRAKLKDRRHVLASVYKSDVPEMRQGPLNDVRTMTFVKQALDIEKVD